MTLIRFSAMALSVILLASGCTPTTTNPAGSGRFALSMEKDQGTVLLDTTTGKAWAKSACPNAPTDWNCWRSMTFDQMPTP